MILHRKLNFSYVDGDYPVFPNSGPRRNGLNTILVFRDCKYRCLYLIYAGEPGVKANGYQS